MDRDDPRAGERNEPVRGSAARGKPAGGGPSGGRSAGGSGLAFAGLGFQFAASLVGLFYLGQWIDRRLGTSPAAVLVCVLVGSGLVFYAMYRQLMGAQRRADAARAENVRTAARDATEPRP